MGPVQCGEDLRGQEPNPLQHGSHSGLVSPEGPPTRGAPRYDYVAAQTYMIGPLLRAQGGIVMGSHQTRPMATLLFVDTQSATYIFSCPSAAAKFAEQERDWWSDHVEGVGRVPIDPAPLVVQFSRFMTGHADHPIQAGPGQEKCKRIQRIVARWWRDRDAWYAGA